jgi:uncharacterized membrane protein YebE (DUF533 family)
MADEGSKKEKRIVDELTEAERQTLAAILLGHRNGVKAAAKSGVNRQTLRYISLTGKGYKKNIQKIRRKLLEPNGVTQEN